ncbi:hypothetical protein COT75_02815 [Candidatus Beckwithbacteria bacterium CG10_big_fil_rev_8_21_14_0_10_34_10]|uniref:Nudix hydrolase domain-containing protein n=1 Tax=Candidatus Beckwithbacteria bacterium CG10_big_fil_rev_8_21_14_0_10_34_10 TaxID=1974495 RepID=A0A2H0W972_9BACT|nr:MAG: hypothetical protein COT75_02815 [Candidatus Beckwithbacteria bacterium CG10_big_fil_rev_8_21_14_0_10_34_10]
MTKKHKIVCAIIINDRGKVLLIKRGRKPFVNYWALISGIGESKKGIKPQKGVIEEVNCDLQTESFKGKHLFSLPIKGDQKTKEVVVFVGRVSEKEIEVNPPYSIEYKWFTLDKLKSIKKLAFNHKEIIEKYINESCFSLRSSK